MNGVEDFKILLFGILLWIPLGAIFLPLYFLFYVLGRIVHKLAKTFRPDLIPINKVDAVLAFGPSNSSSSNVYTTQVWKVRGKIELEAFRNHFYQCFLATEEDTKKYVNLYCYFVEYFGYVFKKRVESIDLNFHIREWRERENGATIEEFVGPWMVSHHIIDGESGIERPSWEIKIIPEARFKHDNGNISEVRTAIVFKLHHGICDGYTIGHLAGKLAGQQAPYLFREVEPTFYEKVKYILQMPYLTSAKWMDIYKNRSESFVKECNEENWLISFCTLDLETVKQIRRVTNTHFVTVLMSIQIGALKKLLQEIKPDLAKKNTTYIGHSMGWPDHPVIKNGGGMTNHLTLNIIKASYDIADPLERLLELDNYFRDTKIKGYPYLVYSMMLNMFKHQPGWFSRLLVNGDLSIVRTETGLSSLLCSSSPHYLMGHLVENLYLPVVTPSLFPQMRLMTVPVSHSGKLDISTNASTALVKDQESLDRLTQIYFPQELNALRKRCQILFE